MVVGDLDLYMMVVMVVDVVGRKNDGMPRMIHRLIVVWFHFLLGLEVVVVGCWG